ncbi:MAG TPA: SDR family NAD(P)-dependent oxidoreductase [Solimonas sp.]|nr:SDR family NAD(P)-dependent oxidoreductase [Solimonas sp.]
MATVLITGARRGIGLDVAQRLLARGHRVFATVHAEAELAPLRSSLAQFGERAQVEKLDITSAADRGRAAQWDIDVLINNAAVGESGPLLEIDLARVRQVFETNVYATLELTQVLVRRMIADGKRDGRGRVIFIGSMAGLIPTPFLAPYAMTKFALESVAFSLRAELKPFGIAVSMINAGAYATGFNAENVGRKYQWLDDKSLYRDHLDTIRRAEQDVVMRFEVKDTASIAKCIVHAAESPRPRKRYAAPWWQWLGVPFARRFG